MLSFSAGKAGLYRESWLSLSNLLPRSQASVCHSAREVSSQRGNPALGCCLPRFPEETNTAVFTEKASLLLLRLATNAHFKKESKNNGKRQSLLPDLVYKLNLPVMLLQCLKSTQRDILIIISYITLGGAQVASEGTWNPPWLAGAATSIPILGIYVWTSKSKVKFQGSMMAENGDVLGAYWMPGSRLCL